MAKIKKSGTTAMLLYGMKNPTSFDKLWFWKSKYEASLQHYQQDIDKCKMLWEYYVGTHGIETQVGEKPVRNVRKMCFEMVESQVDSTVPLPKVVSLIGNAKRAEVMEKALSNARFRLPFSENNDYNSRITLVNGSSFFYFYYDHNSRTHDSVGSLKVKTVDPKNIVPQIGIFDIDNMDYIFYKQELTRQEVVSTYGIKIDAVLDLSQSDPRNLSEGEVENDEILTLIKVFYKDDFGKVGLFSFIGDTIIQDIDNYYARKYWKCSKCETDKDGDSEICPKCGNDEFTLEDIIEEELEIPKTVLKAVQQEDGTTQIVPVVEMTKIKAPYYSPDCFPIVQWDNISKINSFLALSDVEVIKDQQDDINIFMEVIREKALKGGSFMTVPDDTLVPTTNEQLKIIPIANPADAKKFNMINAQVNMQWDLQLQDLNYNIGRDTLGITNSFQGRADATAPSAKAKQTAIDRVSGRLQSKRVMRDAAYSKIYTVMFKFILANADTIKYYTTEDENGNVESKIFDKRLFLEQDKNGTYYYDDEMIISIDQTSTLMQDRQQMWQVVTNDFQSGVYGDPTNWNSIVMLWKQRAKLNYPNAFEMLQYATKMAEAQQAQQEQLAATQAEAQAISLQIQQDNTDTKKKLADASSKRTDADITNNVRAENRADFEALTAAKRDTNESRRRNSSANRRRTGNKTNLSMVK